MDTNFIDKIKSNIVIKFRERVIEYGEELDTNITSDKPKITFNDKKTNKKYTIIMIDPDAPSRNNPFNKFWLHLLIINNDETIAEYKKPSPPKNSGYHRYYICIFEQNNTLNIQKYLAREKFDLSSFVEDNNLKIIGCFKFIVKG